MMFIIHYTKAILIYKWKRISEVNSIKLMNELKLWAYNHLGFFRVLLQTELFQIHI
jgi:hypothetical protein